MLLELAVSAELWIVSGELRDARKTHEQRRLTHAREDNGTGTREFYATEPQGVQMHSTNICRDLYNGSRPHTPP